MNMNMCDHIILYYIILIWTINHRYPLRRLIYLWHILIRQTKLQHDHLENQDAGRMLQHVLWGGPLGRAPGHPLGAWIIHKFFFFCLLWLDLVGKILNLFLFILNWDRLQTCHILQLASNIFKPKKEHNNCNHLRDMQVFLKNRTTFGSDEQPGLCWWRSRCLSEQHRDHLCGRRPWCLQQGSGHQLWWLAPAPSLVALLLADSLGSLLGHLVLAAPGTWAERCAAGLLHRLWELAILLGRRPGSLLLRQDGKGLRPTWRVCPCVLVNLSRPKTLVLQKCDCLVHMLQAIKRLTVDCRYTNQWQSTEGWQLSHMVSASVLSPSCLGSYSSTSSTVTGQLQRGLLQLVSWASRLLQV